MACGQVLNSPDLDTMRRLRSLEAIEKPAVSLPPSTTVIVPEPASAPSWLLTPEIIKKAKGTYGIDFSRYETDDCRIDWQQVADLGLRYVHLEISKGETQFKSVVANWAKLESMHASKKLFRGAYHFLLPNDDFSTDAAAQVSVFLTGIGATGGNQPVQLPPVLDIEPTRTPVTQGTPDFDDCEKQKDHRLSHSDEKPPKSYYCDIWYKMKPEAIVTLALNWINAVKSATGKDVMVYSSPGVWKQILKQSGKPLSSGRAIWIAQYATEGRYTADGGPDKDTKWDANNWNTAWHLPVLFDGVPYPSPVYNVPHFWQFTQSGKLSVNPVTCSSGEHDPFAGKLDFSYIPVRDAQFEAVFGIH
jgi:GH25 family lysozyme M1 (1,4-beta-N-acetylmuramidase)